MNESDEVTTKERERKRKWKALISRKAYYCQYPGCGERWYSRQAARDCHIPLPGKGAPVDILKRKTPKVNRMTDEAIEQRIFENDKLIALNECERNWRSADRNEQQSE